MIDCVATFVSRPGHEADLAKALAISGPVLGAADPLWLAEDEACDLHFAAERGDLGPMRLRVNAAIDGKPVDIILQPVENRRKKLLIADMDSTIIGQECIDELADFVGLKARVAAITERAMRGEIEFEPALRERVALLAGLPADTIERVISERIRLTPGARALVATMRANGAYTILVSGGFTAFAQVIARMVGFNESRANELVVEGGLLAGKVVEPILGRTAKLATIEDAIIRLGLRANETLAVGDGANDLAMIQRAGLGVAYRAKPKVAAAAAARIDHTDLTTLLYAQGYRREEFLE